MRDGFIQTMGSFIKIRENDTFVELDLSGNPSSYQMAIANKYLTKEDITMPKLIRDKFEDKTIGNDDTPITYHKLFMEYLNDESRAIDPEADDEEDKGIVMTYVNSNGKTNRFYIDEICGREKRII